MNSIVIDKTQDGYVIKYLVGVAVKIDYGLKQASSESELTEILRGEGVPETATAEALERVRQNQRSTTVNFERQA